MVGHIFISDCEGPISKNDNAFELMKYFVPEGDKIFSIISKYDDILEIIGREGYQAGDTLKLIVPFLKAYGITNKNIEEYSSNNIILLPGVKDTLKLVQKLIPSFIISTSFEHYIRALCKIVEFPIENVHCTSLDMDKYYISLDEIELIKKIGKEIAGLSSIKIRDGTTSIDDFSKKDGKIIRRLDEIFFSNFLGMDIKKMLDEIHPIGSKEKSKAVEDIVKRMGCGFEEVIYIGDSITDISSFRLIRKKDGVTISFNGNNFAIQEAEIAVLSDNALITYILVDIFVRFGKKILIELIEHWSVGELKRFCNKELFKKLLLLNHQKLPFVILINEENLEQLKIDSISFRKKIRGELIGQLG